MASQIREPCEIHSYAAQACHGFGYTIYGTYATLALQADIHPKVVSERLGHATVSITLDTYSHAIPALQEDAAERVAKLLFGS